LQFTDKSGFSHHLQPQARFLIGLYGTADVADSEKPETSENFDVVNEEDNEGVDDVDSCRGAAFDEIEKARFLVGCQSVRPNGSRFRVPFSLFTPTQVHLVTLEEHNSPQGAVLTSQSFIHAGGEVLALAAFPAAPRIFASIYSSSKQKYTFYYKDFSSCFIVISPSRTECITGARIWRVPSASADNPGANLDRTEAGHLECLCDLPLSDYSVVRRLTASPSETSADLACILGPPKPGCPWTSPSASFLGILRAPTGNLGTGEYVLESTIQLGIPTVDNYVSLAEESLTDAVPTTLTAAAAADNACAVNLSSPVNAVRWSPHRKACTVAVACDSGVLGVDLRSMRSCFWLDDIHWPCVRDLDFNPNRDHVLATAGDDGCVKVWDLRQVSSSKASDLNSRRTIAAGPLREPFSFRNFGSGRPRGPQPLVTLSSHSHWVWSVRYHPTRDQLLVSAGSDSYVCLYGLPSYSSDVKEFPPLSTNRIAARSSSGLTTNLDDFEGASVTTYSSTVSDKLQDGLLAKVDQHEECVYAVDWSPVDTWVFASVNYDGTLLVNRVPDSVKLGILLHEEEEEE
uniref:Protein TSSC1 n=2 Tax=Schistocephalus solidus TaxID=70667 RepID=A0A183T4Q5_SCHSO